MHNITKDKKQSYIIPCVVLTKLVIVHAKSQGFINLILATKTKLYDRFYANHKNQVGLHSS